MNSDNNKYRFKLFIAGMNPGSFRAIENVKEVCESCLKDDYELEVIDIYQQKQLLRDMDIFAVPTLIRISPEPEKRIIGDMADKNQLVLVLEISSKKKL